MTDSRHALGYLRTSSQANVGEDKDSERRQRVAIERGAAREGYTVVDWFYDADVRGDVEIADRPGFSAMLDRIEGNGVRVVFVESADRFARKMLTSELGIVLLVSRGVTLMTATGEDLTNTDDEMRVAFRQIAMAFSQLEKTRLVKKLKGARDRKSVASLATTGRRIEGQKGYTRGNPELVRLAKSLMAGRTLLATSAALAEQGHVTANGKPFSASQVKRLIEAGAPTTTPQSRHAAILAELDARKAPDADYRVAFSSGSKVALRRGETWRGRLEAWVRAAPARA